MTVDRRGTSQKVCSAEHCGGDLVTRINLGAVLGLGQRVLWSRAADHNITLAQ